MNYAIEEYRGTWERYANYSFKSDAVKFLLHFRATRPKVKYRLIMWEICEE